MRNKRLIFFPLTLTVLVGGLLSLTGCDEVLSPYPPRRPVAFIDTVGLDSIAAANPEESTVQRALLEDYTGHQCGNCPRGAEDALAISNQYGNKVVVMGVHVGFFAEFNDTGKYSANYNTEAGNAYNAEWRVEDFGLPQGMVNRKRDNSSGAPVITRSRWRGAVAERLADAPRLALNLVGLKQSASRIINVRASVKALAPMSQSLSMVCWLTEDSIKSWQKDYSIPSPGDNVKNYTHRHVLRTAVNGPWGDAIAPQGLKINERQVHYYGFTVPPAWNLNKIHAVVAIFDTQTKEIIQVDEY